MNNGLKVAYPTDNACELNTLKIPGMDGTFSALQFHIHTSSEHTIDGGHFGAEMHIVHFSEEENLYAVVGMMIQPTAAQDNELFGKLLTEWSTKAGNKDASCELVDHPARKLAGGERKLQGDAFNAYALLDMDASTFYNYMGGLTTPPCSEVVVWNLADTPVQISIAQYNEMSFLILGYLDADCHIGTAASPSGSTSRPVQPLNGREVKRICPVAFEEEDEDKSAAPLASIVGAISMASVVAPLASIVGAISMASVAALVSLF